MLSRSRVVALGAGIVLLCFGCGPDRETQNKLAELTRVSHERDQMVQQLAENARMMSEISADLAKVRVPEKQLHVSSESPAGAARDSVVQQIHYITARVNETERRLRENQKKITQLTSLSDSLRNTLQATITNYDSVIASQRSQLATLTEQINQLTVIKAALIDTVNHLNTVYYIVGTSSELVQRGVLVREGGSRFPLIVAKLGQVLVPARELDPNAFTPIDKRSVKEIPLPESSASYRIASRQDLAALVSPPDGGKVSGSVKIADPDKFWGTSRFLILIKS